MQLNSYKINEHYFSLSTIKDNIPSWFSITEMALTVDGFILLQQDFFDDNDFLHNIGLEMITNMNISEEKLKSKMNSGYKAFFTMDKFYFRKKDKGKWFILEDDDFKNFHDWLLATLNPELYSNKLRKIKLKQIMK